MVGESVRRERLLSLRAVARGRYKRQDEVTLAGYFLQASSGNRPLNDSVASRFTRSSGLLLSLESRPRFLLLLLSRTPICSTQQERQATSVPLVSSRPAARQPRGVKGEQQKAYISSCSGRLRLAAATGAKQQQVACCCSWLPARSVPHSLAGVRRHRSPPDACLRAWRFLECVCWLRLGRPCNAHPADIKGTRAYGGSRVLPYQSKPDAP